MSREQGRLGEFSPDGDDSPEHDSPGDDEGGEVDQTEESSDSPDREGRDASQSPGESGGATERVCERSGCGYEVASSVRRPGARESIASTCPRCGSDLRRFGGSSGGDTADQSEGEAS